VESLLEKSYVHQLVLFKKIMLTIERGGKLPKSKDRWAPNIITRRELNNLATIRLGQSAKDVAQRIKATTYKGWVPRLVIGQDEYDLVKKISSGVNKCR